MADAAIPDGFVPANFAQGFLERSGPYWLRRGEGYTIVGLSVADPHLNYVDMAHGGVLTTLADVAMSFQVHDSERPRLNVVTNSFCCNFLAPARRGDWVEAHMRIDRLGKRLAHTSGRILSGDACLMTASAVFTILRPS